MTKSDYDPSIKYRMATVEDSSSVRDILGYYIESSTVSWRYEVMDLDCFERMIQDHQKPQRPFWIAEKDKQVVGFGYLESFRSPEGYWPCVEDSVYVHPDHTGQGIGRKLLKLVIESGRDSGLHTIVAAIDADNKMSIDLHKQFGFEVKGKLTAVGWKHNGFRDLVLMQLIFDIES